MQAANGLDTRHWDNAGILLLGRIVLLACGYYVAALLSLHFAILPGVVSPLWPPAAIALCGCLFWGWRVLPAVWLGATAVNWYAGLPFWTASTIGLGNSMEALAATILVRRLIGKPLDFTYPGNIFRFVGIAAASSMIAASVGMIALSLLGAHTRDTFLLGWLTWWLGDATGIIVIAPLILARKTHSAGKWGTSRIIEAAAFVLLLCIVIQITFSDLLGRWAPTFLPIPFLIWAAFRFSMRSVAWTTGLICTIAVWNTSHDYGPFATDNMNVSLLLAVTYTSVVGIMGLALASLVNRQRAAEKRLRRERDLLERRVQHRTEALTRDIEKRKCVERELAAREGQLAEAQHLAQIGSWNWDLASGAVTWSDELYRIYGVSRNGFATTMENCRSLIHEQDRELLARVVRESRDTGKPFHIEHRILWPSGEIRTVAARGFVAKNEAGKIVRIFGTTQDITEAKRAELALREAEERYRLLVELCPDAILVNQDDIIIFANPAATALLGADNTRQLIGQPVMRFIHPEFHDTYRERMALMMRGRNVPRIEERLIRLDSLPIDVDIHSSAFTYKGAPAILTIVHDVSERKKSAEQLAYLAHYDSLTGLPNRALFHQRLAHALDLAERPGKSLEILFLDLDRFKYINDTLGHASGDLVLKETAERLQGILRESDTVARLGGDEFVILVENIDEPHHGGTIAEKILATLAPPFMQDREPLNVTASIGISNFPADGADAETLLKKADIAMYRAKEAGRSAYRYYSAEMNIHTAERLALEYALSHAIERRQLSLHYQPKFDVVSHRITGMEALLRWDHPTLGSVAPQRFIALAEETGQINAIGKWAIRSACMQNRLWQESHPERLKVAVNLSPRQLSNDNLIADIREILADTGLAASYLELEITEGAMMANPGKGMAVLNTLHNMGVSVVIDDFGVGYSSLAYLKQFPIHAVKIDRSFVQGVPENRGDAAITKAIISLAHSLECNVTAEGAETHRQYEFLREHHCDSVQGYYFSEPVNAERFGKLLHAQAQMVSRLH